MGKLQNKFEWITRLNTRVAGVISITIPILALLIMYEIIMRYGFGRPTTWVHDISQFLFGAGYMLGAGYTLAVDGHANMDMFYSRFKKKGRAVLDIISGILFQFYVIILTWKCGLIAWDSVKYREVLTQSAFEPPLYPIKIILFIGCILLLLQGLLKLLGDIETVLSSFSNHINNSEERVA